MKYVRREHKSPISLVRPVVLAVAVALLVAACGGGAGGSTTTDGDGGETTAAAPSTTTGASDTTGPVAGEDWTAVEEAAREEGELVLYTATFPRLNDGEIAAFNEAYPDISVTLVRIPSSDIRDRFSSEREAGAPSADVIKPASAELMLQNPNWFVDISPDVVPNVAVLQEEFVFDKHLGLFSGPFVWTYNSDLVAAPPVDICTLDKVAADYEETILLAVPGPGGGWDSWAIVREACGDDFLIAIGELVASGEIAFYDSSATAVQEVAAGAAAMNAWGQAEHSWELRDAGAPVDFAYIENPEWGLVFYGALASEAANPNAARVYVNWLLSRDGVEAACGGAYNTLTNYDDIADCPVSPPGLQVEDPKRGAAEGPKIDVLLGR
ncbi:MAG: extracellular solute-binding protein [Acidimicrobiia bacterium]|nr:extracellular solute-binding protein [Acidimicrobiia bacterium]